MDSDLALYIHWPFCVSKCPYCDFNSHVRESIDVDAWRTALLADMAYEASQTPGRILGSIFFGGGTPSLMPPVLAGDLIAAAARHWRFADDIEITLEANPSSVEAARFADLAAVGINRVSLGLQALHDDALRFLGRAHDVTEGLGALDVAQRHFARVNFDLIYARPGQSIDAWGSELTRAMAFGTDHLSLYQLTIEPGTRFETMARKGDFTPMDGDTAASLYELTQEMTRSAGIPAYEISNHARTGQASRHNLTYWRYGDYVGIGPGAHGRRSGAATIRHKKPENWMEAVQRNGHGCQSETPLGSQERASEALLMGLRLAEGVNLTRIAALSGVAQTQLLDSDGLARMVKLEMVSAIGNCIAVTPKGMLVLNAILAEIVAV